MKNFKAWKPAERLFPRPDLWDEATPLEWHASPEGRARIGNPIRACLNCSTRTARFTFSGRMKGNIRMAVWLAAGWALLGASAQEPVVPAVAPSPAAETVPAASPGPEAIAIPAAETNAPAPELWFPIGEELVYDIYWGKIHVGQSRATTDWVEEDGRRLLRVRLRTRTNKVLSLIYPVNDHIESRIDPNGFIPVLFVKNLSEGRNRNHEETRFNHAAGVACWTNLLNGKSAEFPIAKDTRDIPALMYYLRQQDLQTGTNYDFKVMADEKIYDMTLETLQEETVSLPVYGKVRSLRMEPKATFGGVFVNKGRMWVWVSRDERRVATKISAEVPVARVHLYLREILGPGPKPEPDRTRDETVEDVPQGP
jgi:hypothetical protein